MLEGSCSEFERFSLVPVIEKLESRGNRSTYKKVYFVPKKVHASRFASRLFLGAAVDDVQENIVARWFGLCCRCIKEGSLGFDLRSDRGC